jgi:hypothetical protein
MLLLAVVGLVMAAPWPAAEAATVLVFNSTRYVDANQGSAYPVGSQESENVQAALASLGHTVQTIAGPYDSTGACSFGYHQPGTVLATASEYQAALAGADVFLIPEQESWCYLPGEITPDIVEVWRSWVQAGGGLIIHSSEEAKIKVADLLEVVFGFRVGAVDGIDVTMTKTSAAASTPFAAGPATLPGNPSTGLLPLASLPSNAVAIYANATDASVVIIPFGDGKIVFLGWDWTKSNPPFSDGQDNGWMRVLAAAVTEAATRSEPPPPALAPTVALHTSKTAAQPGDLLQVNLTVANSGEAGQVDVYFGALLPPEAGPRLGCPGGDAVAFVADNATRIVTTCLSSSPAGFAPYAQGASLPGSLPETTLAPFWEVVLPAGLPAGTYTLFLALTPPGALADGRIDAADVLALTSATFTYGP